MNNDKRLDNFRGLVEDPWIIQFTCKSIETYKISLDALRK
jgi:hypothetical protein